MIDEFAQLGRNVIVFGRMLRSMGLGAQPDRLILLTRALATVGLRSRGDAKAAARAVLVRNREEAAKFDAAFDAFWSALHAAPPRREERSEQDTERDGAPKPPAVTPSKPRASRAQRDSGGWPDADLKAAREEGVTVDLDRSFTYTHAEALYQKDFAKLSKAEEAAAAELAKRQAWDLGRRRSRRFLATRGAGRFDPRRTLRAALRRGGEVLALETRMRRVKQRDLVLLCDISGSMDRYSRLLLQFVHTVRHAVGNVEAFVFGTRLTRITRQLRHRNVQAALDEVSRNVADWAGGTRIGECLRAFNQLWARRVLGRGAIVIIISDGWDRGDIDLLAREMQRLQRSAYRLVWLNPLLGSPSYRPQTVGMQAALPYIDDFLPAHNLKNLMQFASLLNAVDYRRPNRAQQRHRLEVSA